MRKSQKLFLLLAIVIMFSALTGCSGNKKEVEEFIEQYVEDVVNGKWDQVLQKSTGDQLSIYTQLVPSFEQIGVNGKINLLKVKELEMNKKGTRAEAIVHLVKTTDILDYGTVIDEKTLLYKLKKIDGEWKVYQFNIIIDSPVVK